QELHQRLIRRRAGGLNEKDIAAADVVVQPDGGFSVGEIADVDLGERNAEILGNRRSEFRVAASTDKSEMIVHRRRDRCGSVANSSVTASTPERKSPRRA